MMSPALKMVYNGFQIFNHVKTIATPDMGWIIEILGLFIMFYLIGSSKYWKSFTGEFVIQKEKMKRHAELMADTESEGSTSSSSADSSS